LLEGIVRDKRLDSANVSVLLLVFAIFFGVLSTGHCKGFKPTEVLGFSCGFSGEKRLERAYLKVLLLVFAVFWCSNCRPLQGLQAHRSAGIQLWVF
jgi:hypothetical protein